MILLSTAAALPFLCFAQSPVSFRYFYDDTNELYRVLDSTGTLIEYTYDLTGNITNVSRTTLPANQLSILNVTPSNTIGGSTIMILGQNFSAVASGDIVMIGGVTATVVSASTTKLVVTVPGGTAGGAVSVTVNGVTATWSNTITALETPAVSSVSPASGKAGATVTLTVMGVDMSGATFSLPSVDPIGGNGASSVTVVSNTGTTAVLTVVLGTLQGQFGVVATNSNGPSVINPAAAVLILPTTSSAGSYTSVLNTSDNISSNPPFPPGQNTVSFYASVLNTSDNITSNPPFPPGQNTASFYASVLNTSDNITTNPPFPPGQNSASFYASVLNTSYNPITNPPLPAGQNAVSYYISVCNTDSGCTAMPSSVVSANASPTVLRARPGISPPSPPSTDSTPVLDPLEESATVTVGQTIRLTARNVAPGSIVEFDVNETAIATVGEAPYETVFTVPDGPSELAFQVLVRTGDQSERLSQVIRLTVVPDPGANISGSIAQTTGGLELSLAAGGLRAEYFHLAEPVTALPSLDALQSVRSGYVTAINEPNPRAVFGDDPLGARLSPDYAVRFSGEVRAEAPGQYRFWLTARSGAAILIDGKILADSGFVSSEPAEAAVSVALGRGWHSIEVIYYLAVGASSVGLDWQQPNSSRREVVGPEYLRTILAGMTAVSAADGTFTFPKIPTKFDSVWIRVRSGDRLLEFPAVKPGAGRISLSVPK